MIAGLCLWRLAGARLDIALRHPVRRVGPVPCAVIFFLACLVSGSLSWLAWPVPTSHDEFSYLLAADTFASLRLSNPSPALWPHFESFHVLAHPAYASKYPPGQGLALSLGQWMTGEPIAGAWITAGIAGVALFWMLAAWVPAGWAWLGALLACAHPLLLGWSQSYMGGGVALAAAALVLGAAKRLGRKPSMGLAAAWGSGVVGLAVSRPYEGLVATLLSVPLLFPVLRLRPAPLRLAGAAAVPLAVGFAALGAYHASVTGHPTRLPYAEHASQYSVAPNFLFQTERTRPVYRHPSLERLHAGWELSQYQSQRSPGGFARGAVHKLGTLFQETMRMKAWWIALLALPWAYRRRKSVRYGVAATAVGLVAVLAVVFLSSHYVAPFVPLLFLIGTEGLRAASRFRPNGAPWGARAIAIALAFSLAPALVFHARGHRRAIESLAKRPTLEPTRAGAWLAGSGGKHLILIPRENRGEPAFNRARWETASVVWARSLGPSEDERLVESMPDRAVWRPVYRPGRTWLSADPLSLARPKVARIE